MTSHRLAAVMTAGTLAVAAGLLTTAPAASAAPAPPRAPHQIITPPPPLSGHARFVLARPGRHICYIAHVENIGWQAWVCDGAEAGTTGMSLRMEALAVASSTSLRGICADAHVQNIGWQGWQCTPITRGGVVAVGTTGLSLRMEALALDLRSGNGRTSLCAQAHVQNIGWMTRVCGPAVTVGTTGQSLRMEAVEITV